MAQWQQITWSGIACLFGNLPTCTLYSVVTFGFHTLIPGVSYFCPASRTCLFAERWTFLDTAAPLSTTHGLAGWHRSSLHPLQVRWFSTGEWKTMTSWNRLGDGSTLPSFSGSPIVSTCLLGRLAGSMPGFQKHRQFKLGNKGRYSGSGEQTVFSIPGRNWRGKIWQWFAANASKYLSSQWVPGLGMEIHTLNQSISWCSIIQLQQ